MVNPRFNINISYQPSLVGGQKLVSINGVTQSMPSYTSDYFVASMPEVRLSATGPSYTTALNNLLIIVGSATDPGYNPLSFLNK